MSLVYPEELQNLANELQELRRSRTKACLSSRLLDTFLSTEFPLGGNEEVVNRIYKLLSKLRVKELRIEIKIYPLFSGKRSGGSKRRRLDHQPPHRSKPPQRYPYLTRFLNCIPKRLEILNLRIGLFKAFSAFPDSQLVVPKALKRIYLEDSGPIDNDGGRTKEDVFHSWKRSLQFALYCFGNVEIQEFNNLRIRIEPSIDLPVFASRCRSLKVMSCNYIRERNCPIKLLNPKSSLPILENLSMSLERIIWKNIDEFWKQWIYTSFRTLRSIEICIAEFQDFEHFKHICTTISKARHPLEALEEISCGDPFKKMDAKALSDYGAFWSNDQDDSSISSCMADGLQALSRIPSVRRTLTTLRGIVLNPGYRQDYERSVSNLICFQNLTALELFTSKSRFGSHMTVHDRIDLLERKRQYHHFITQLFRREILQNLKTLKLDGFWMEEALFTAVSRGRPNLNLIWSDNLRWGDLCTSRGPSFQTDSRGMVVKSWEELLQLRDQDHPDQNKIINWDRSIRSSLFRLFGIGDKSKRIPTRKLEVHENPATILLTLKAMLVHFPKLTHMKVLLLSLRSPEDLKELLKLLCSLKRLCFWSADIEFRSTAAPAGPFNAETVMQEAHEHVNSFQKDFDEGLQRHLYQGRKLFLRESRLFGENNNVPLALWPKAMESVEKYFGREVLYFLLQEKLGPILG